MRGLYVVMHLCQWFGVCIEIYREDTSGRLVSLHMECVPGRARDANPTLYGILLGGCEGTEIKLL